MIFLMLLGGFIWTQIISRSTAICMSLSRNANAHRTRMDDLNVYAKDLHLSELMRQQLRKFFLCSQESVKHDIWHGLETKMSPKLRRESSMEVHYTWVSSISFLRSCPHQLVADVASLMTVQCFSEQEIFGDIGRLYIVVEGLVSLCRTGTTLAPGELWGEDHLLLSSVVVFLSDNTACALEYVQCSSLSKQVFDQALASHPEKRADLRRLAVRLTFQTAVQQVIINRRRSLGPRRADSTPAKQAATGARRDDVRDALEHRSAQKRRRERKAREAHEAQEAKQAVEFAQAEAEAAEEAAVMRVAEKLDGLAVQQRLMAEHVAGLRAAVARIKEGGGVSVRAISPQRARSPNLAN